MGINPTQSNFKSFTFDGTNSRAYGVYITGEGVFNAPERNVEMVDIPGRNGAFALDKGNFNNIEVTYPAGIFADTEADFAQAVSDLRNLLCSKVGYVRLEDDYNPNEYRLAIYKSGLDVDHDFLIAGEFELVFECKPQRFLKSGETAISVTSGNTITNPTRFDARPLLEVSAPTGGSLSIGGKTVVALTTSPLGRIVLDEGANRSFTLYYKVLDVSLLNSGDQIFIEKTIVSFSFYSKKQISTATKTNETGNPEASSSITNNSYNIDGAVTFDNLSFAHGTSSQYSSEFDIAITFSDSTTSTAHFECTVSYDGTSDLKILPLYTADDVTVFGSRPYIDSTEIVAESSIMPLSKTVYVDCELGDAYIVSNDKPFSINRNISFGADLPVLKSGSNSISYTFPTLKITPRWWQV